jgi:hypothetical protein
MSEWKTEFEDGQEWHFHDTFGNVVKMDEGCYVAMLPKVIKLGPFKDVETAKKVLSDPTQRNQLDQALLDFNDNLNKDS